MRYGVDWAWGAISPAALHSVGASFACRYLSLDPGKNLSPREAQALSAAGIDIVVVWETTAGRAFGGYNDGVVDARRALAEAQRCGKPAGAPIFFAVDEDTSGIVGQIFPYFQGVNAVLGRSGAGAYGGYSTIKGLFDAGLIGYGWQAYAWSRGAWDGRAHLRQVSNDHVLAGVGDDIDEAWGYFGQWRVGQNVPPSLPPYWFLMPDEKQWVLQWNHLRGHRSLAAHRVRVKLRNEMTQRRKAIYYRATHQRNGWNALQRLRRYNLLKQYTTIQHPAKSAFVFPHD